MEIYKWDISKKKLVVLIYLSFLVFMDHKAQKVNVKRNKSIVIRLLMINI